MVNVVEEVHEPHKTLPRAIFLTLIIATLIYLAVVTTMVAAAPIETLAGSKAPLALVFKDKPVLLSSLFNLIAIIATVNGALIQIIMVSRVLYGMSNQGNLPAFLGYVQPRLRTPLTATLVVAGLVLAAALTMPIARLAEATSQAVLIVFAMVNAALIALRLRDPAASGDHFRAPAWAPVVGLATSLLLLATSFIG